MKAAWFIAVREVRDRMRLFVFAVVFAVMPFAATLLPGTKGHATDTIAVTALCLSVGLGAVLAVVFGTSISRDLVERRMSFWFTKPVSATSIWIGKSAAALFVALACWLVVAVPSMLAVRSRGLLADPRFALLFVLLYLISHVLSTMIRSRSVLLALDFAFLLVALVVLYLIVRPLYLGLEWGVPPLLVAIVVGVLVVVAIAPVWQLANGRSDIRRSHAALMRFLWSGIAVMLLIAGGVVSWILSVPPSQLSVSYVAQAPRGPLVMMTGTAERRFNFQASYLINRATGGYTRIGVPLYWGMAFSDDGRVAAWLEPVGFFKMRALELHTNVHGATGIEIDPGTTFVLSPDGSRVAMKDDFTLTVYDLASRKLLVSAAGLDASTRDRLFFLTRDVVRVIEHQSLLSGQTPMRIFELDVPTRKLVKTGERMVRSGWDRSVTVSGDGSRMFAKDENLIADGRTGAAIATLPLPRTPSAEMLYDGRVAAIMSEGRGVHLGIFDRNGALQHDIPLPQHRIAFISAETEDGKLILAASEKTTIIVNLATGTVERTLPGMRGPEWWWSSEPRITCFAADQELLAMNGKGELVLWKNEGRTAVRPLFPSR